MTRPYPDTLALSRRVHRALTVLKLVMGAGLPETIGSGLLKPLRYLARKTSPETSIWKWPILTPAGLGSLSGALPG